MKRTIATLLSLLFGLLILLNFGACTKEESFLEEGFELEFSMDTVAFDTVFTTMGTTTQMVKVYNRNDKSVKLQRVTLQNGRSSYFRLNVDGDTSMVVRNFEIAAHDSAFIFVQAYINPNSATSPFLIEDAILFSTAQEDHKLPLTAYGRNAVYHKPDHLLHDQNGNAYPYSVIDCANWNHSLPHIILGYAVVDSSFTLSLIAGDELYFDNNAYLWVYKDGSLKVNGTADQPVLFTSLRHDGWYDYLPGQWGYIWISDGSKDNVIDWAVIENGYAGLFVNTMQYPGLVISNTIVRNHSLAGILGQGSSIIGDNLLVETCGSVLLALQYGGRYQFSNSTFANYYNYDRRTSPSVVLSNGYEGGDQPQLFNLDQADFRNCIIYGNYSGKDNEGEILFVQYPGATFSPTFDHCLLRSTTAAPYCTDCLFDQEPKFENYEEGDYHPKAESPVVRAGSQAFITRHHDLSNNPRTNPPSIGAYEMAPEEESKTARAHRR